MTRCRACGGAYQSSFLDGTRYFHACSPLVDNVTGETAPRPNARNENVPPPAILLAQLNAVAAPADPQYQQKRSAAAAVAMISAGAGVAVVVGN